METSMNYINSQVALCIQNMSLLSSSRWQPKSINKLKLDTDKSCGYLKAFLDTPGVIRNVYKIARLIVLKSSHLCIVGYPRMSGREILQLATLVFPDTELYEPEVKLANDIMGFKDSFKKAILRSVSENKDIVFLYDTNHLDDQLYIDYMANFINLFDKD